MTEEQPVGEAQHVPRWVYRLGVVLGVAIMVVALLLVVLAGVWLVGVIRHQAHHAVSLPAGPRDPRQPVRPAIIGTALSMTSLGTLRVTTYCATGTTTASGTWPQPGDVATLDRSVPFGTVLWIDQAGTRRVTDRIGHGSDVDLYDAQPGCTTYADRFGVHRLHVAVVHER